MATMPTHLNIKNFNNPAGNAITTTAVVRDFMQRYNTFISKSITMKVYHDGKSYVFVLKIPSEKNYKYKQNIFYDVIVEFYPTQNIDLEKETKFVDYAMRVYSNCPTFTYNFTYVYEKMGSLYKKIPIDFYNPKSLTEPTKETNPYKLVGIEKSVWYALRKIYDLTWYNRSKADKLVTPFPEGTKFPGNAFAGIIGQLDKMTEIHDTDTIKKDRKQKAQSTKRSIVINGREIATEERGKSTTGKSNLESRLGSKEEVSEKLKSALKNNNISSKGIKSNKLTSTKFKK